MCTCQLYQLWRISDSSKQNKFSLAWFTTLLIPIYINLLRAFFAGSTRSTRLHTGFTRTGICGFFKQQLSCCNLIRNDSSQKYGSQNKECVGFHDALIVSYSWLIFCLRRAHDKTIFVCCLFVSDSLQHDVSIITTTLIRWAHYQPNNRRFKIRTIHQQMG